MCTIYPCESLSMILFLIAAGSGGQTLDQLFSFLKTKNTDDFNSLYSDIIDREFLLGRSLFVFGQWCLARRLTLMPSLKEVVTIFFFPVKNTDQ